MIYAYMFVCYGDYVQSSKYFLFKYDSAISKADKM